MTAPLAGAVLKRPQDYRAYRIKAGESNRLVIIFDPPGEAIEFICCVEIFDPGGVTPPNTHRAAQEFFYVLEGSGRARCNGHWVELRKGDSLLVRAGSEHVIENTGDGRLYTLTVMVPDEDFAQLIRSGVPVALDAADLRVLQGLPE
jgi:mannose-6-phosphate isomerase-like protein (cupin superfamily)